VRQSKHSLAQHEEGPKVKRKALNLFVDSVLNTQERGLTVKPAIGNCSTTIFISGILRLLRVKRGALEGDTREFETNSRSPMSDLMMLSSLTSINGSASPMTLTVPRFLAFTSFSEPTWLFHVSERPQ
jgi:hypothetical protein